MTPAFCRIKHDPDNGTYGDCFRACVATVMDMDCEDVPHFYHDNDPRAGYDRLNEWLAMRRFAPFYSHYDGSLSLPAFLSMMAEHNPHSIYILYGATDDGQHVVVCKGGSIVHNPAWYPTPLVKPGEHGYWTALVIARA